MVYFIRLVWFVYLVGQTGEPGRQDEQNRPNPAYLQLVREGHRIFLSIDAAWLPLGQPEGQVLGNGLVGWVKCEMKDSE